MAETRTIVVIVEGGSVSQILGTPDLDGLNVILHDYDNDPDTEPDVPTQFIDLLTEDVE